MKSLFASALLVLALGLPASASEFTAVFVDAATEKELGPFPYDRGKTAQVAKRLHEAGARALVIKYFLDQPKPGTGDDELAAELARIPSFLQARLDPEEAKPNALDARFSMDARVKGDRARLLAADAGWIPLAKFATPSKGVGFVDIADAGAPTRIPLVVGYGKHLYPSLQLRVIEWSEGKDARIELGKEAVIGSRKLKVNAHGETEIRLPAEDRIDSLSFADVLKGKFDTAKVRGRIVVLGYDGANAPVFETKIGKVRLHRLFYHSLVALDAAGK